jgi:hypothetical protein
MHILFIPEDTSSNRVFSIIGRFPKGSISFGMTVVSGLILKP